MTIAAIHQPQYLPYLGFFHKLSQADIYIVMDNVEFLRRGLQHRNKVKTKDGDQWLTVPVLHQQKQLINQVQINNETPWCRKHWGTIQTNYSRAPYFEAYAADLQAILSQDWQHLWQLNMALIRWAMEMLGLHMPMVLLSQLPVQGQKSDRLIEACKAVGANTYLSGPGGRQYMDMSLFEQAGVEVIWQEFTPPTYPQLFPQVEFIPNLSILDVLFCCGDDARQFLGAAPQPALA